MVQRGWDRAGTPHAAVHNIGVPACTGAEGKEGAKKMEMEQNSKLWLGTCRPGPQVGALIPSTKTGRTNMAAMQRATGGVLRP